MVFNVPFSSRVTLLKRKGTDRLRYSRHAERRKKAGGLAGQNKKKPLKERFFEGLLQTKLRPPDQVTPVFFFGQLVQPFFSRNN